jgi:uncharacterized damage-inducible protein DinB
MKKLAIGLLLMLAVPAVLPVQVERQVLAAAQENQNKKPTTLRDLLLSELRSTHTSAEWFVPANTAVKGLSAEQANWTDGKGNHSVGQLAYHLVFWNRQNLARLKGEKPEAFGGNNDETFTKFDSKSWDETVRQLDDVMKQLENWVQTADEAKLKENAQTFTHISTHNAYHVGQIIFVRKEQGSWDPKNGVN